MRHEGEHGLVREDAADSQEFEPHGPVKCTVRPEHVEGGAGDVEACGGDQILISHVARGGDAADAADEHQQGTLCGQAGHNRKTCEALAYRR